MNVDIVQSSGKATDIFRPCFLLLGYTIELILPERSRSGCLKRPKKKDKVALTRAHRPVTEINPLPRSHSSERERTRFAWPPKPREQVLFHSVACFSERAVSVMRDSSNHQIGSFRARMETSLAFSSPDGFKVSWEIAAN